MNHRINPRQAIRGVGLLLTLVGLWLQVTAHPGVATVRDRLEHLAYDLRLRLLLEEHPEPHPDILIVSVDEESLARIGRWPWPRTRIAELLERLADAGAAVIALDMVFGEAERAAVDLQPLLTDPALPEPLRKRLADLAPESGDARLATTIGRSDTVLGFVLHTQSTMQSPPPFEPPAFATDGPPLGALPVPELPGATFNLPQLSAAASGHGFVTVIPDDDGVIRRVPLLLRYRGQVYPSLALAAAGSFLFSERPAIETATTAAGPVITGLRLADSLLATDPHGTALVPFRAAGRFAQLAAWRILEGGFDPDQVAGRIVLVGTSALGLSDLRPTPVSSALPGVEVHASLLAGLLAGRLPTEPDWVQGANASLIAALGLLLVWLGPRLSAASLLLLAGGLGSLLTAGNLWLWQTRGLALAMATPLLVIVLLTGWFAIAGFARASRSRRELQQLFGQYVPPQIVARMAESPEHHHDRGETREMTVLFADIRGFTTLSETLEAEELSRLLNRFFTPMTRIIFEHGGTIDKYVGDMIMAFWNAPVADPEHATHAVAAALAMCDEMQRLNRQFRGEGLPELRLGIGVNTGPMHVGDMGSRYRRTYTVLGDSVNLGARLEGLTRLYGVDVVVGPRTAELAASLRFRPLDRIRVKGKQEAVEVFEPLAARPGERAMEAERLAEWEGFLTAFREQRWEDARALLGKAAGLVPDALLALYRRRLEELARNPPPADWDGSFERAEK